MNEMTLIELFAGVGGWSEAAKMAGAIQCIAYSEIDNFKINIYEKRHFGAINLGDIRAIKHCPYAASSPFHSPALTSLLLAKVSDLKGRIQDYGMRPCALLGCYVLECIKKHHTLNYST